jgi:hypothetical protein
VAQLLADENFPLEVVEGLRRLGHDVLTSQDSGQSGKATPDAEVLAFATSLGRAVLTLNRRDFIRLHFQSAEHAGIIVCSQDPDTEGQAGRIHNGAARATNLGGQLIRVNRPSV